MESHPEISDELWIAVLNELAENGEVNIDALSIADTDRRHVLDALFQLEADGWLEQTSQEKWTWYPGPYARTFLALPETTLEGEPLSRGAKRNSLHGGPYEESTYER